MNNPYAYVLYIDRGTEEHLVSLHQTLDGAEAALRDYAASIFVGGLCDGEIVEVLAEDGICVRIFACTAKRNTQVSTELQPFARSAKAA